MGVIGRMVEEEHAALVATLSAGQWRQPSLCAGWSVRDVVAHLIDIVDLTPWALLTRLAGSRLSFARMFDADIAGLLAGRSDADLLKALRARMHAHGAPPEPRVAWLAELLVHGEDIFRALRAYRPHPVERVIAVADFYRRRNPPTGGKRRIAGMTLRASDTDWLHGSGPEATGPVIALLLAMAGHMTALDDLTGPGVALLRSRT